MAQTGKKINELTAITTVSNETVLPAVYVINGNASSTANKVSIEQISNKITEDISTVLEGKQDKLTAGEGIDITNNVISTTQTSTEESIPVITVTQFVIVEDTTFPVVDDITQNGIYLIKLDLSSMIPGVILNFWLNVEQAPGQGIVQILQLSGTIKLIERTYINDEWTVWRNSTIEQVSSTLQSYEGFSSSKTQAFKNVNGTMKWIDEV